MLSNPNQSTPISDALSQGVQNPTMPANQPNTPAVQSTPQVAQPSQASQPVQPQAKPAGSLFRQLLAGALQGMAAGFQGESLDEAQQRQAQTKLINQQTANAQQQGQFAAQQQPFNLENWQLRNQLAQAQIQAIPDSRERDRAAGAYDLARTAELATVIHTMPQAQAEAQLTKLDDFTSKALDAGSTYIPADTARGFSADQAGSYSAATTLLQRLLNQQGAQGKGKAGFSYLIGSVPSPNGRQFGVLEVPNKSTTAGLLSEPMTVNLGDKRFFTFPAGTPRSTVVRSQFDYLVGSIARDHADAQKKTADQIGALKENIASLRSKAAIDPKAAGQIQALQTQLNRLVGLPDNANMPDFASLVKPQQSNSVQVQIPGAAPGTIPRASLQQFMKDHPNAKVIE
ncbi:MAG TPA: hypothetical protein VJN69_14460 [Candidatus Acidoferrales bacterium]|nr:hypothetical protein [Candidatus Acidoferrales bacterium]